MIPITLTENFLYGVNENLILGGGLLGQAFSRAMALAATCEADFQRLLQLFRLPNVFGPNNRISISIDASIAPRAAGENFGYTEGGQTQILIVPTFPAGLNADAAARGAFTHEMAEILMSYQQQKLNGKWIANHSTGEALADICSDELHPEGQGGPWITAWLNSPQILQSGGFLPAVTVRPNWVDQMDPTDGNIWSAGCGVLFINFLRFQLGRALDEIIAKGGTTLAETYQNLTGRSDGSAAFFQLVNTFFPFGPSYNPQTDNLFPLPQLASLTISPDTVVAGDTANATVSLDAPHPGLPLKVDLICGAPGFASLPSPPVVVIDQNQTSANFPITTPNITVPFKPAEVIVYASSAGVTVAGTLTVKPAVEAGILKSVTLSPTVVTSGRTSIGTVTLETAVEQDTEVGLAVVETGGLFPRPGDESSIASLNKPSVSIRANATTATFTIETAGVSPHVSRTATVLAHAVVTKSAQLTVEGA